MSDKRTIYLVTESFYYRDGITDSEVVFACFDESLAKTERDRLEQFNRVKKKRYNREYTLSSVEVTEVKS